MTYWKRTGPVLAAAMIAAISFDPAAAQTLTSELVATGLSRPVHVTSAPGDLDRLYIVEQHTGDIEILNLQTGTLNSSPFHTQGNLSTGNEQGLLGLAFHPQYPDTPYCYINFTRGNGDTRIRRLTVANPDSVVEGSGVVILTVDQPDTQTNHNGGWLGFGPDDGFLYIAMGDGGGANDQGTGHDPLIGNGQALDTMLGKVLRIDVDTFPYAVPPTNPFVGNPSALDEIWAYGVRNPWRCDFDPTSGDFYIADVGQSMWEEISYQPAASPGGENYGWREFEGYAIFNCPNPCDSTGHVGPIHVYSHGGNPFRCSITGGVVYRGQDIIGLSGTYFFADYCSNQIWTTEVVGGVATNITDRTSELAPGGGLAIQDITSFGRDGRGEIYVCDQGVGASPGEVYRILQDPTGVSETGGIPASVFLSSPTPNPSHRGFAFRVGLPSSGDTRVRIYDTTGRIIRTVSEGALSAGNHPLTWDGRDDSGTPVAGGVYLLRLESGVESTTRKMTIVR